MKPIQNSINEMILGIKADFKQKIISLVSVFCSASLFRLCLIYNQPLLALVFILIFSATSGLAMSFVFTSYLENVWMIISHFWKVAWLSNPPIELVELSKDMGISSDIKVGLREGIGTAYANKLDKSMVFDSNMFLELNRDELLSIAAHEMHHLRSGISTKYIIYAVIAPMFAGISLTGIPNIMIQFATLSAMLVFMIPVSWSQEHDADKAAVQIFGADIFVSALRKVIGTNNPSDPSLTHPSLNERITKIMM